MRWRVLSFEVWTSLERITGSARERSGSERIASTRSFLTKEVKIVYVRGRQRGNSDFLECKRKKNEKKNSSETSSAVVIALSFYSYRIHRGTILETLHLGVLTFTYNWKLRNRKMPIEWNKSVLYRKSIFFKFICTLFLH